VIGRTLVRVLAACIGVVLWPVGRWDQWHTAHPGDPWETDE
jgi:hypothetical protein